MVDEQTFTIITEKGLKITYTLRDWITPEIVLMNMMKSQAYLVGGGGSDQAEKSSPGRDIKDLLVRTGLLFG